MQLGISAENVPSMRHVIVATPLKMYPVLQLNVTVSSVFKLPLCEEKASLISGIVQTNQQKHKFFCKFYVTLKTVRDHLVNHLVGPNNSIGLKLILPQKNKQTASTPNG